jgi:glycosyltransferase involved in cell wall biosynthesis
MAEKIEDVLRDDGLRQELVNKGLDNVKRFRWDKTVKNIINLIHDDSR